MGRWPPFGLARGGRQSFLGNGNLRGRLANGESDGPDGRRSGYLLRRVGGGGTLTLGVGGCGGRRVGMNMAAYLALRRLAMMGDSVGLLSAARGGLEGMELSAFSVSAFGSGFGSGTVSLLPVQRRLIRVSARKKQRERSLAEVGALGRALGNGDMLGCSGSVADCSEGSWSL